MSAPPLNNAHETSAFDTLLATTQSSAHAQTFKDAFDNVDNEIFKVVFFPDRIYHERYFNATRSPRYRYAVSEVRSYLDITALKAAVWLDGVYVGNVLRIEYGGTRLVEQMRDKGRFLGDEVMVWLHPLVNGQAVSPDATVKMQFCPYINAFQVELWETLEPPAGKRHAYSVLDQIGRDGSITRAPSLVPTIANLDNVDKIEVAFREVERVYPSGNAIGDADICWDNAFLRSHQEPRTQNPSDGQNTIVDDNYLLAFQRGWYLDVPTIQPVNYRNAMMDGDGVNPDAADANILHMRWIVQRELGGSMIFFHEVTIPPEVTEGCHQHIGSEELYYIVQGSGTAYMHVGDDPATANFPTVKRMTMGIGWQDFKELPVSPGKVIYTKSGGMHGIRNTSSTEDLKFVAFLYHST